VCAPRARSSTWDGQPVTHERHRRGVIFGVDRGADCRRGTWKSASRPATRTEEQMLAATSIRIPG